jgi:hypothetical protein
MYVEIGTVAAQFLFWKYLFRIYCIGSLQWMLAIHGSIYFFCRLYPVPPPHHRGSVRALPVICLLISDSVSLVRACLIKWWERFRHFRGTQKRRRSWASLYSILSACDPQALHTVAHVRIYFAVYLSSSLYRFLLLFRTMESRRTCTWDTSWRT